MGRSTFCERNLQENFYPRHTWSTANTGALTLNLFWKMLFTNVSSSCENYESVGAYKSPRAKNVPHLRFSFEFKVLIDFNSRK